MFNQYLAAIVNPDMMRNYIDKLQSLITLSIVSGHVHAKLEQIELAIIAIDFFYDLNQKRPRSQQLKRLEFQNDAINNNIELRGPM